MSSPISRRRFLRAGATLAAGAIGAPLIVPEGVFAAPDRPAASDRVPIGFIGAGGRARLLMSQMPKEGEIVAICDVWRRRCDEALKEKKASWRTYQDYRKLLEAKDIEAVVIATPDHGRVIPSIHACQAGKDIYAEKPLTLTIHEGRVLVNAVRKHSRVFQVGSQQRSMEMNRYACELVRKGGIGKLHTVLACNYTGPGTCDDAPEQPVPDDLDWDTWLSQTKMRPYNASVHLGWMGCRSFSGGEMTNWGAHGVDQVQWGVGADGSGPVEMWPESEGSNGKVTMRYASGVLLKFELANGPMGGAVFVGDKGKIHVDRNRFEADPKELVKDPPEAQKAEIWEGPGWQAKYHIGNWLECIKTRAKPVADVEIGHRSISVCHLANITRQVGRKLKWDPERELFVGDEEANTYLQRPRRKGYELPDPL